MADVAGSGAFFALFFVMTACSRAPRDNSKPISNAPVMAATADAPVVTQLDAAPPAPTRFVEHLSWRRGGEPVDGCRGQDKWVGPEPLPDGTLVRYVDYHHSGSRGILVGTDGSLQTLDARGKLWSPAGHLTARQLRQLSRALSSVDLSALFPAYFTTERVHDQGGISIDIPDGAEVRGLYFGSACHIPELRGLRLLLASLIPHD